MRLKKPYKQEKTIKKNVCVKLAKYVMRGENRVLIPAEYEDRTEKVDIYVVEDADEKHEFATKAEADRFYKGQ